MSTNENLPRRWNIFLKMALISVIGLAGLLILGGIGYWVSSQLTQTGTTALRQVGESRAAYARTTDVALRSEEQARILSNLNEGLIDLQQLVVEGTNGHKKGINAETIIKEAQALAKRAEVVKSVAGADTVVPGTNGITVGDQVVGNFNDVAVLLEFELPEIFAETPGSDAFVRKQGSTVVAMTGMYWFISQTLGEMSANIGKQVEANRIELQKASNEADRIAGEAGGALEEKAGQARTFLSITFLVTVVVLAALFIRFASNIIVPLKKTVVMAEELKNGRVHARLDVGWRNDEFSDMARALNDFAENLEREVVGALEKMARGDLVVEVHPVDPQDKVRGALQKMAADMNLVLGQIQLASHQISSSSAQVASSSQGLSEGASTSASSLEEISASLNELASQTRLNADNAVQANRLASQAKDFAKNGNVQMVNMVSAMGEINDASKNISKIIKVIDEIAFQTNLLALNAAVEAARAGQHGKGFAVVAEEVRSLAARSAKAAQETAQLIDGAVSKSQNGSRIADATAKALDEIVCVIGKVSDLVGEINAASHEQAEGISQVNTGLGQIDQVTQQNTASAEESASAAEELSHQADKLRQMLARFVIGEQQGFPTPGFDAGDREEDPMQIGWG
ncbi:MAG: hypothetical protein A2X84_12380 [Desulfuromonadaceae bacterium GWC2_58_13]|nr:MAG: hypothetical protein A2X84_12380 [Desulfuromonadaceae bacterium GWC2_58_13]